MKITFPLQNPRIDLLKLLNFQMWPLIYELNKDIIQSYECIEQTETTLEYIYQFIPISLFPSFYIHTIVTKQGNQFIANNINNERDKEYKNCIQLNTYNETILIEGDSHNVVITVDMSIKMDTLPDMIEPIILKLFKKIYTRLNNFITNS